jgi:CBS domain-containing protein
MTASTIRDQVLPGASHIRARDLMSRHVVAVGADVSINDAIKIMLTQHISGLPVLDPQGKLVGIVSEGDFLRRAEVGTDKKRGRWLSLLAGPNQVALDFARQHGRRIGEIMSPAPVTIDENTTLEQIVRLMESLNMKRFPVMRGDEIVGMVTRADFMRAVLRFSTGTRVRAGTDDQIRSSVLSALSRAPWRPSALDVTVQDAVVTLQGNVNNDNERKAAVVAAENVAGVRRVDDQLITYPLPEEDLGGGDIVSLEKEAPTEDDVPL